MATVKKVAKKKTFAVKGTTHVVDKHGKKVDVHHPGKKGKTYTLPAKTVKEGVKAVKDWHKKNG